MGTLGSSRPMFLSERMKNEIGSVRVTYHQGLGLGIPSVIEQEKSSAHRRSGVGIIVRSTIDEEAKSSK